MSDFARSPGCWLQVIGGTHAAYGAVKYRAVLAGMAREGLVATVPDEGERATTRRQAGTAVAVADLAGGLVHPRSPLWAVAAVGVATVVQASSRAGRR